MELRDFIVTPFVILAVYGMAYLVRPYVCDSWNYKYFFPALTVKIIGALAVGFIYQFYYNGGDTFYYHTRGSRIIWEAFVNDPAKGLELIFFPTGAHGLDLYQYTSRMSFQRDDPASYMVVRIAAFCDLFTFSTYSATATIFAVVSFCGAWFLFLAFYKEFPGLHKQIALAIFFVPSVFFWGSGILKDSIIISCLGIATYCAQRLFIHKKGGVIFYLLLGLSLSCMFLIRKYVLLCFVPAVLVWIYSDNLLQIRSTVARVLIVPFVIGLLVISSYYALVKIGEDDPRYALDKIAETSKRSAYDIGFITGKDAGSGYSLGELDGTFLGMIRLAPQAVNVSLFRPYLWEIKNPLMLISAIESFVFLGFTVWIIFSRPLHFFQILANPYVLFCLVFSVTFAFAVGVSTFNFGTLARYKIPMLPFYAMGLVLLFNYSKRDKNPGELEITE